MNTPTAPQQSETNAECFTNFPTQVKSTRPDGRAPPPGKGLAHSRPEPPDHGLRAALRAVLSRAGGPAAGSGPPARTGPERLRMTAPDHVLTGFARQPADATRNVHG
jgi:hypothetical protein